MKTKIKKYSLLKLGFLLGSICSIFIAGQANAGFMNTELVRCSEHIVPYSTDGRVDQTMDYVNVINPATCESHAPLSEHYQGQERLKAEHPLANKSDIENVKVPYARHNHQYTFDATSQGPSEDKVYSSQVYAFRITLHPDAVKNTDMSKLNCDFPIPASTKNSPKLAQWTRELQDCNGHVTDKELWGGLRITTTNGSNGSKIVEYTFDTGDHNEMPVYYSLFDTATRNSIAKVDSATAALQPGNPTETNTRDVRSLLGTNVRLVTLDKTPTDEVWTATTTSEVQLIDWAIPKDSIGTNWEKSCYDDDDNENTGELTKNNSWCVVPPLNVGSTKYPIRTTPGSQRYWYSIATVVTAWRAPVIPDNPVCELLTLDKTKVENGTVCAKIVRGTYTGDLEWTLNTDNKDAILDIGMVGEGDDRKRITGKTVNTSVDTTRQINGACATVRNLKDSDSATLNVRAVGTSAGSCSARIKKTPEKLICEDLTFTKRPDPNNFVPGEYCVKASPNNSYTGPMKFSITGKGEFKPLANTGVIDSGILDAGLGTDGIDATLSQPISSGIDATIDGPSSGFVTLQTLKDNPSQTVNRRSNGEWCTTITGVGDNAKLDIAPTADEQAAKACNLQIKNKPKAVCEELELTPSGPLKDGEYCVSITKGSFTGDLQWKAKNGDIIVDLREYSEVKTKIDSTKDNKSCVTINVYEHEPNTEVTVTAVGAPQCSASRDVKQLICEDLTFTKRPDPNNFVAGDYCVKTSPENSYTGPMKFKINGKGKFNQPTSSGVATLDPSLTNPLPPGIDATIDLEAAGIEATLAQPALSLVVLEDNPEITVNRNTSGEWCTSIPGVGNNAKLEITPTDTSQPAACSLEIENTPEKLVCEDLTFVKRPNGDNLVPGEYCVQASPQNSYEGQMRFWIEGQGSFKTQEPAKIDENIINGPVFGTVGLAEPLIMELAPEYRPKDPFYGGYYTLDPSFFSKDPQSIVNRRSDGTWCATINSVGDNAKFKVAPTDVEAAKVCNLEMEKTTEKPVCEQLKLTPPGELNDGEYCVSVERGKFKGNITWTISGGEIKDGDFTRKNITTVIDSEGANKSCILVNEDEDATSILSVAAENEPDCIASANDAPVGDNVCTDTRWTRRANFRTPGRQLICVRSQTSDGARYDSGYQWQVDGPGGFENEDGEKIGKITAETITTGDEDCIYVSGLERSSRLFVRGLNGESACSEFDRDVVLPPPPDKPPVIRKGVKNIRDVRYSQRTSVPNKDVANDPRERIVEYEVSYDFDSDEPVVVTIRDEIGEGNKGQLIGTKGGTVDYIETRSITHKGNRIGRCEAGVPTERTCFTGNIANERGVTVYNATGTIRIVYTAEVNSKISDDECNRIRTDQDCAERFFNRAFGETVGHENGVMVRKYRRISEDTEVLVSCRFFLTRAGGDVFFEQEFDTGVDVQFCGRRNTTGIIIKRLPTPEGKLPKTGVEDQNFAFSHKVCQLSAIPIEGEASDSGDAVTIDATKIPPIYLEYLDEINKLPSTYQDPIKNFSSLICEIQLATASSLNKEFIQGTMQENVTRIARWNKNLDKYQGSIPASLFVTEKDQVFRQSTATKSAAKLSGLQIPADAGARTIIVEGQDLIIDKNITYPELGAITNPRTVPSLAIIVLGGDIIVNKNVSQIDAVMFTQADPTTGKGGQVKPMNDENSNVQLRINGSVFGDIQPLVEKRNFAGDPKKDEGAIVIRYDERIILNTPPGLKEVIDIDQLEVARGS